MWLAGVLAYALTHSAVYFTHYGWKPYRVEAAWFLAAAVVFLAIAPSLRSSLCRPSPVAVPTGTDALVIAVALAVTLAAYVPVLRIGFLSDDFVLMDLAGRPGQAGWSGFVRPAPLWVFGLAASLSRSPDVFLHALNLALHLASGALVWWLSLRIGLSSRAAIVASALFLVFPASVEAVAWCSGLQETLMTTGTLCALALIFSARGVLFVPVAGVAALLAKETGVAMPLIAAALLVGRRPPARRLALTAIVISIVLSAFFAVWRASSAPEGFLREPSRYLIKQIVSVAFGSLAVPFSSVEIAQHPALGLVLTGLIALALAVLVRAPSGRGFALSTYAFAAWVLLSVGPVYSMFFVSGDLQGSRYLYLPAAAWAMWLALMLVDGIPRKSLGALAAAVVLALWSWGLIRHVSPWVDAASARDEVVAAAAALPLPAECGSLDLVDVPDNVRGAYVFRNGLDEALRQRGVSTPTRPGMECRYKWTGTAFVPLQ